eukprot:SAG31_NODE_204_length_20414_cov_19.143392_15_plen_366_part_00
MPCDVRKIHESTVGSVRKTRESGKASLYHELGVSHTATVGELETAYLRIRSTRTDSNSAVSSRRVWARWYQLVAALASRGHHFAMAREGNSDDLLLHASLAHRMDRHNHMEETRSADTSLPPVLTGPTWLRVSQIWSALGQWYRQHCPKPLETLLPPVDAEEWRTFLTDLGLQAWAANLEPVRLLYSVHNGQYTKMDASVDNAARSLGALAAPRDFLSMCQADVFSGLFGGYSTTGVYASSVRLFSVSRSIEWTRRLRNRPLVAGRMRLVEDGLAQIGHVTALPLSMFVVAATHDLTKIYLCDAAENNGQNLRMTLLLLRADGILELPRSQMHTSRPTLLRWIGSLVERMVGLIFDTVGAGSCHI